MGHAHTHTRAHSVSLLTGKAKCSSVHLPFPKPCFVHYQKTVRLVYVNVSGGWGWGVPLTLKVFIQCIDVNPRLPS